ncbi:MAG: hypothetical protein JWR10_1516 [Rubritepida sp.]|nr:hypothetical protein [Rubritepida sp.]
MPDALPFWKTTPLDAMTPAEWESLCDGCGRCCLHKLREDDTGRLHHTEIACRLLDTATARCTDYPNRKRRVPDCIGLTPAVLKDIDWLPPTCGYRLIAEGRDLPDWHPLRSGDEGSVIRAGVSVRSRVISERKAGATEDHIATWPGAWPRRAGTKPPVGSL